MGVDKSECEWVGARFSITHFFIAFLYTFRKNLYSVIA